ncbi:hypothetical protein TNCV_3662351 [Trichonephila clavipes]|nr:hypothetical protein TNCV_3662351 [Trichonephila clavipes]
MDWGSTKALSSSRDSKKTPSSSRGSKKSPSSSRGSKKSPSSARGSVSCQSLKTTALDFNIRVGADTKSRKRYLSLLSPEKVKADCRVDRCQENGFKKQRGVMDKCVQMLDENPCALIFRMARECICECRTNRTIMRPGDERRLLWPANEKGREARCGPTPGV